MGRPFKSELTNWKKFNKIDLNYKWHYAFLKRYKQTYGSKKSDLAMWSEWEEYLFYLDREISNDLMKIYHTSFRYYWNGHLELRHSDFDEVEFKPLVGQMFLIIDYNSLFIYNFLQILKSKRNCTYYPSIKWLEIMPLNLVRIKQKQIYNYKDYGAFFFKKVHMYKSLIKLEFFLFTTTCMSISNKLNYLEVFEDDFFGENISLKPKIFQYFVKLNIINSRYYSINPILNHNFVSILVSNSWVNTAITLPLEYYFELNLYQTCNLLQLYSISDYKLNVLDLLNNLDWEDENELLLYESIEYDYTFNDSDEFNELNCILDFWKKLYLVEYYKMFIIVTLLTVYV